MPRKAEIRKARKQNKLTFGDENSYGSPSGVRRLTRVVPGVTRLGVLDDQDRPRRPRFPPLEVKVILGLDRDPPPGTLVVDLAVFVEPQHVPVK